MDVSPFSKDPSSASLTGHEQPGFQGKASYEWGGRISGKAWVSGMSQQVKARAGDTAPTGSSVSAQAFDIGAKVNSGGLEGVLYAYTGDGVGTTAIGFDAAALVPGGLAKRKSKGGYGQVTYKFGKFKPRSEEHTSELQSRLHLVCRLLLEKKKSTPAVVKERKRTAT